MKKMKRVVLVVLDGVGCGAQADADKYGDAGANTLGHVYEQENPIFPTSRNWACSPPPALPARTRRNPSAATAS